MSDTFREQLVTRYRAATLRVTKDELHDVLKEYDATAPDRERAVKALAVFEEAAKHGPTDYGCDDTQPLCPLYDYCHWACGAQMLTRLGRDMGILPEEAK